jgi:hypothetical protein
MIEKIFIPTVKRVDNQITYNNLSDELRKRVVFVVQAWERDQYHYDAEYLVLPDWLTYKHEYAISETRQFIYRTAGKMRYVMMDDDIVFVRRNQKYFGLESNMEKSKRLVTDCDINYMFKNANKILDEHDDISYLGCSLESCPPADHFLTKLKPAFLAVFIDGSKIYDVIISNELGKTKTCEDILFNLCMATNGKFGAIMNEFCCRHRGLISSEKLQSPVWEECSAEQAQRDQKRIAKLFPKYFKVYDDKALGYRNKAFQCRLYYKKACLDSMNNSIDSFLK